MSLHERTEILLGDKVINDLSKKHILVAGIGGVGCYVAENLARAGVGELTLLDADVVADSNINRQLVALHSTVGKNKTEIMQSRILDINPDIKINIINEFMNVETAERIVATSDYDFIADCIDTIACKAQLVLEAQKKDIPIISAMGAGNRIDATKVRIISLNQTQNCPLAREIRRRLRGIGANLNYPVVFSDEPRRQPYVKNITSVDYNEKATNGTISYMPAIFGILLAGEILKNLIMESESKIETKT